MSDYPDNTRAILYPTGSRSPVSVPTAALAVGKMWHWGSGSCLRTDPGIEVLSFEEAYLRSCALHAAHRELQLLGAELDRLRGEVHVTALLSPDVMAQVREALQ